MNVPVWMLVVGVLIAIVVGYFLRVMQVGMMAENQLDAAIDNATEDAATEGS